LRNNQEILTEREKASRRPRNPAAGLLASAPPPCHSVLTWIFFVALFSYLVPSLDKLDEVANVETFTHRVFPEWISVDQLGIIRLSFAAIIWLTTLYGICSTGSPLVPNYVKGTRLKPAVIQMNGIKTLGPFTSWAWIILGAAFSSSGKVCLLADADQSVPVALVRTAAICWETAAPFTILLATKFTNRPFIEQGGKTESLKKPRAVLQHNADILMAIWKWLCWVDCLCAGAIFPLVRLLAVPISCLLGAWLAIGWM
jgi:hypothetical protein